MKSFLPAIAALFLFITACQQEQESSNSVADSTAVTTAPGAALSPSGGDPAVLPLGDPGRRVIRTADLRCRVGDVYAATTGIERITYAVGGQVTKSALENQPGLARELPWRGDSLCLTETHTPTAALSLRIPVARLDTVLGAIAAAADFIHHRKLLLDDVTLRYLGNQLRAEAIRDNDAGARAQRLARRSEEAEEAGRYRDAREAGYIDRRLQNLELADQAAFATLSIELYGQEQISRRILPDLDRMTAPGAGARTAAALQGGWQLLASLLIALLSVWPLLLAGGGGWLLYRSLRGRSAGKAPLSRS